MSPHFFIYNVNIKKFNVNTPDNYCYNNCYCNYYNNENAIIIGRVGAYCGTVYYEPDKCWISDNALFAESKNNAHFYNYYLLKNMNLNARQIGTGQPLITQGLLNKIKILLAPDWLILKYDRIAFDLLKQQNTLRKQNINLAEQRDMLLPRLMSGIQWV